MNCKASGFANSAIALAIAVMFVLATGRASAKDHKEKTSDNNAHVVAHIAFNGMPVMDMTIQRRADDKYYLYVQHSRESGISIVDIGKPAQPKVVGVTPWPNPEMSNRITLTGGLAIIDETEVAAARGISSTDDLVLWDMSNPAAPRVVQKFTGVVKWLQDERNFVYVLNGDGLWVISEPAQRQPEDPASST